MPVDGVRISFAPHKPTVAPYADAALLSFEVLSLADMTCRYGEDRLRAPCADAKESCAAGASRSGLVWGGGLAAP